MEYYNKDFDADRPVQYKEIRREMAKVYDIDRFRKKFRKKLKCFFFDFVLLKWEQFTVVNNTVLSS